MELMVMTLVTWVFIGFAVAWLLGRASDLDGQKNESTAHDVAGSHVTYRFIQMKGLTGNRPFR